ncbi:XTP/dITP diphosphatase [Clostridium algidicarnis]|uniref:dITP/XTP pyrophosphatase n=1 Tax=Clostridium algidicarnis DSM 15099 TaxID=1121295 RepID=A0A2S6FUR8_9CLOT|nr:XTP/dITP diphosphatase [Clostridium algidicarnis]MBB6631664.1 XTP/dITP diphosphatase [Clostridium algidicarnis]MBB6698505.1 XTP/dITP diphosphatase [Clostridium algidicarnis]MBU3194429.1 XTP/dITP diphosphatase [Clostridium algidicarnis]MBU3204568.1 XTP/dITP diphosphatase [Clostridium algidicarnis]MBU3207922.1 XTP/dITP diphosphatase [Clostridium algidicarnis]
MKDIILATNNEHKVKEFKDILKNLPVNIYSLKEVNVEVDVEETGTTFIENSKIKVQSIYYILKEKNRKDFIILADDSGLMVEYLNGDPGIYSARYAGEHGNSEENNKKLLLKLKGVPYENRRAKFVSAIALMDDEARFTVVEGEAYGYIIEDYRGGKGFGYDPLFYFPGRNKTFAEMSEEEKNGLSHRGKALKKLKIEIEKLVEL